MRGVSARTQGPRASYRPAHRVAIVRGERGVGRGKRVNRLREATEAREAEEAEREAAGELGAGAVDRHGQRGKVDVRRQR